jgi:hypothetical protein
MQNTIDRIVKFESSMDNCFCELQEHLRGNMQAIEYGHLGKHYSAVSDIIANTLQEMRNVQAAGKARERREKLDALQAMFEELGKDLMDNGLDYKSVAHLNEIWNSLAAEIRLGIYCIERGKA